MLPDYYRVLGVPPDASLEAIKRAYRQKAMRFHPDQGGSHAQMVEINEAFEVLSDPHSRRKHDFARAHPEDSGAQTKAASESAKAREHAQNYPREWSTFETWLNGFANDVRAAKYGSTEGRPFPTVSDSATGMVFLVAGAVSALGIWFVVAFTWKLTFVFVPVLLIGVAAMGAWAGVGLHRLMGAVLFETAPPREDPAKPPKKCIPCPRCQQKLRVPVVNARIQVTCPCCQEVFAYPSKKATSCPHCSQKLRVPWSDNPNKVTCPCCRKTFRS